MRSSTTFQKGHKKIGGIGKGDRMPESAKSKEWRKAILSKDDYTCQICKVRGGKLEVDHIKPFAYFPELRFELSNGRVLCRECHKKTDTYAYKAIKQYA